METKGLNKQNKKDHDLSISLETLKNLTIGEISALIESNKKEPKE